MQALERIGHTNGNSDKLQIGDRVAHRMICNSSTCHCEKLQPAAKDCSMKAAQIGNELYVHDARIEQIEPN